MNAVATRVCLDTSETIAEYKDMVYGIALTHTRCRTDAEDVFQEVFLVYHRKQPLFESTERRKAWLITTTLNCAKQVTASSWHKKVVPLHDNPASEEQSETFHFRTDAQDAVFTVLQELPLRYRTVLHLFYFEDLSVAQIASTLDIEPGTVKVQLSRGRAQMRDRLQDLNKGGYFDE